MKCWYAKDRAWSEEKEKDFRNRLGDNDPRVKLDAIAELSGKGFFGASTPSYILGEMLLDPDEIQLVKISILNAWVANQSLEALHFMERYSLDTQNSEANIKMVMQYGSKITLYDSGKRMLQRLEEAFEKSGQKTLKRWATFLLRK